jgi:hypothetical protein
MAAKRKREKSELRRDADDCLRLWDRPPSVRSRADASRLWSTWLKIFYDESPAWQGSDVGENPFLHHPEVAGVVWEPADQIRAQRDAFVAQSLAQTLSKRRQARRAWVDMLAKDYHLEHLREELDTAIRQAARAYHGALIRNWLPSLGRGNKRSTKAFCCHVKHAVDELKDNEALRTRLRDAAQLLNRCPDVEGGDVDPRDDISVNDAIASLTSLAVLAELALDLHAKKPPRGSHAAIRSSCKPLQLFWTNVAGRNGRLYHAGEEASEMAWFLSHCLLLFDRSATPRTVVRARGPSKKQVSDPTRE